jgi:hypothetical protein
MDLSQLKTQVMTMFMMKAAQAPAVGSATQKGGGGGGGYSEIWSILYGMMVMNMVEYVFKHIPVLMLVVQGWVLARWRPSQKEWLPSALSKSDADKEKIHSVTMTRVFQKQTSDRETNVNVEKVDAVLEYICALDSARHVRLDTRYTIGTTEDIHLTPDLKGRVKQVSGGGGTTIGGAGGDEVSTFEIVLFSTTLRLTDIRAWIDDVHKNYVFEKNNKLGNNIYYFNEIPHEPTVIADMSGDSPKKTYRWDNMPKTLTFNMNEFKTSKSFTNVYGGHVDELKERLDLFVNHPEWYADRGIPHSLGIMLHGIPGAGKTSTIKAIAKDTHRHIFNLSLRPFTTQKQLLNLFFNEAVVIHKYDGSKTTYNIPINRRVYVIEDIDCMTDVTLDRGLVADKADKAAEPGSTAGDAVTLSFLLNLLDGVLETPGRILVITSNYPEKLDKALVRPGRIDVKIEFKNASRAFIREMVSRFYSDPSLPLDTIPADLDNVFTPAEVMESLCTYFKDPAAAIQHLVQKRPTRDPCLKVYDFPLLPPSRGESSLTTGRKSVSPPVVVEEDAGTSLESLGISASPPKNELIGISLPVVIATAVLEPVAAAAAPPPPPPPQPQLSTNTADTVLWNTMAYNGQNAAPRETFLNSGLMVDAGARIPYEDGISENVLPYLIPNPDFICDTSGIGGFDSYTNPSSWSDARDIDHPILDEGLAGTIQFNPPNRLDTAKCHTVECQL